MRIPCKVRWAVAALGPMASRKTLPLRSCKPDVVPHYLVMANEPSPCDDDLEKMDALKKHGMRPALSAQRLPVLQNA